MAEQRSGLIAGLSGITMLFAAFTSAYVVRRGISSDWVSLQLPGVIYASALPLAASSIALGAGRRSIGAVMGAGACIMQLYGWRQIDGAGPATAFFFVISGAFLILMICGVMALLRRASSVASHFYYWLYLSALWIYLLLYFTFWN
jgi:cytochrome c oxidase subunit 3